MTLVTTRNQDQSDSMLLAYMFNIERAMGHSSRREIADICLIFPENWM